MSHSELIADQFRALVEKMRISFIAVAELQAVLDGDLDAVSMSAVNASDTAMRELLEGLESVQNDIAHARFRSLPPYTNRGVAK